MIAVWLGRIEAEIAFLCTISKSLYTVGLCAMNTSSSAIRRHVFKANPGLGFNPIASQICNHLLRLVVDRDVSILVSSYGHPFTNDNPIARLRRKLALDF